MSVPVRSPTPEVAAMLDGAVPGELDALARRSAGSNGFGAPEAAMNLTHGYDEFVLIALLALVGCGDGSGLPSTAGTLPLSVAAAPSARFAHAVNPGTSPFLTHAATVAPHFPGARELPPLDSLRGLASDYEPFLQPGVDENLRRAALKKLFSDPYFNVPDPFEAYSGDFTGGEPIPSAMLKTIEHAKGLLFDEGKPRRG